MTLRLLPCTLKLNPCATFLDLMVVGISLFASASPDRRFLLLEIFSEMDKNFFSMFTLLTYACKPCLILLRSNLHTPFQRYYKGVEPPELFHSDSFRWILVHSLHLKFNYFSRVESSRLCAPSATTVFNLLCSY
jgi:hypothetical protein